MLPEGSHLNIEHGPAFGPAPHCRRGWSQAWGSTRGLRVWQGRGPRALHCTSGPWPLPEPLNRLCAATGRPWGCLPCRSDHAAGQLLPCPPACPSCCPGTGRQRSTSKHGSGVPACLGPRGSHLPSSLAHRRLRSLTSGIRVPGWKAGPFPAPPLLPQTGVRGCSQRPAACPTPWPCWGFCNGSQAWAPPQRPFALSNLSPEVFDPHVIFAARGRVGALGTCSSAG